MALTADQRIQFFQIIGLPSEASGLVVTSLVHVPFSNTQQWEPTWNVGDMTDLISAIDDKLTAATTEQITRLTSLITRFMDIEVSPMRVTSAAAGAGGNLVDHASERENIRQAISNVIGLAVPEGGYIAEIQRTYGKSMAKWASNLGDR